MSKDGNGVDLAAIYGAILALSAELRTIKAEQRAQSAKLDSLAGQVGTLRGEVASYHSSVVGHGVLISELEQRVGQFESRGPTTASA